MLRYITVYVIINTTGTTCVTVWIAVLHSHYYLHYDLHIHLHYITNLHFRYYLHYDLYIHLHYITVYINTSIVNYSIICTAFKPSLPFTLRYNLHYHFHLHSCLHCTCHLHCITAYTAQPFTLPFTFLPFTLHCAAESCTAYCICSEVPVYYSDISRSISTVTTSASFSTVYGTSVPTPPPPSYEEAVKASTPNTGHPLLTVV